MITMQEWKAMSCKEQTLWLEENAALSRRSKSLRGLVCGVGVNNATYRTETRIDGKRVACPAYAAWNSMLNRSCSAKYHARHQTYSGVTVCDEWRSLMSFRKWWLDHQVDGWQLDKDLLTDDWIYSPETCIFVPRWMNTFTTDHAAARGEWPMGVCYHKITGKFLARCRQPLGKQRHIGLFSTPEEAHAAWLARKLEIANELKHLMDDIDARIFPRVIEIISRSK